jgi:hypothetical protein
MLELPETMLSWEDFDRNAMERIERSYFENGNVREEVSYKNNIKHGPIRKYHPNGVLAEEYWFEHGQGTGVNKTWDEHGVLRSEIHMMTGKQIGRMTVYNEDGTILYRHYALERGKVSREKYDLACMSRPELPRYTDPDPPKGKRVRTARPESKPVTQKQGKSIRKAGGAGRPDADQMDREFVAQLMSGRTSEASAWLRDPRGAGMRTLGEMDPDASIALVDQLYGLGAGEVLAVEIEDGGAAGAETANHLLVRLPQDAKARARLFEVENQYAEDEGFDGETDRGQEFLYIKLC